MASRFASTSLKMFGNFVTGLAVMSPAGMLADLATGLGVSVYPASLLITFGAVLLCIGSPLMTWLTSTVDRRLLLSGSMLGVAVAHAAAFVAPDYPSVLVLRLVMLAIIVVFTPVAAGTTAMIVAEDQRPRAIVLIFSGVVASAGAADMPLVGARGRMWAGVRCSVLIGTAGLLASILVAGFPAGRIGRNSGGAAHLDRARQQSPGAAAVMLITTLQVAGPILLHVPKPRTAAVEDSPGRRTETIRACVRHLQGSAAWWGTSLR